MGEAGSKGMGSRKLERYLGFIAWVSAPTHKEIKKEREKERLNTVTTIGFYLELF